MDSEKLSIMKNLEDGLNDMIKSVSKDKQKQFALATQNLFYKLSFESLEYLNKEKDKFIELEYDSKLVLDLITEISEKGAEIFKKHYDSTKEMHFLDNDKFQYYRENLSDTVKLTYENMMLGFLDDINDY